jgi:dCTP deaminase
VLLSDRDIKSELGAGRISLEPYEPDMIQPSSIDVRLDRYFRLFDNHKYPFIDPAEDQPELTRLIEAKPDEPFILHPGEFVLGSTYELVSLPDDVAARLEGKSSLGRLGLLTHSTAGFIDPGFSGHVTLELSNVATLPINRIQLALPGPAWPDRVAFTPELSPNGCHSRAERGRCGSRHPLTPPTAARQVTART